MTITAALILFAVIWFLVLFIVLPLRLTTQGEAGRVVPGTPASAPEHLEMSRKLRITTIIAVGLWVLVTGTILSGVIGVRDFDWLGTLPPEADGTGG